MAKSRTCRERGRSAGRCGAAACSAPVNSGSSVTWIRRYRVAMEEVYHRSTTSSRRQILSL